MVYVVICLLSLVAILCILTHELLTNNTALKLQLADADYEPEYGDTVEYWKGAYDNQGILLRQLENRPCSCCGHTYAEDVDEFAETGEMPEWDGENKTSELAEESLRVEARDYKIDSLNKSLDSAKDEIRHLKLLIAGNGEYTSEQLQAVSHNLYMVTTDAGSHSDEILKACLDGLNEVYHELPEDTEFDSAEELAHWAGE